MKKAKKLLFMGMVFAMILALFPNLLLKISADQIIVEDIDKIIYANGNPITIEEGSRPELTKIKYGNDQYLDLGNGATEKDLSQWDIAGGTKGKAVENTEITMTGGKIRILIGGGRHNGPINNNVNIDIQGGTISTLYGGGAESSPVKGNVNINFSGGEVKKHFLGGGTQNSPVKKVSINISGGKFNKVYGGGYDGSRVEGDTDINITGGKVGKVYGGGVDDSSSVEGKKNGTIKVPTDTAINTFDDLIGKDKDGNWNIKGDVTLQDTEKIVVDEGKVLNILSGSTLTLSGEIENNGTIDSKGNLNGSGTLSGNGSFKTSHDTLTSDDIELQTQYPYTGEVISPIHHITKKIEILGQEFEISNWNFTGTEPTPVQNVGSYRIIYKKDNAMNQVTKDFNVTPADQGGSIHLKHEDKNNDQALNTGDVLSVNMDGLRPKGGTPAFSWKRIADNSEEEIVIGPTYTVTNDDRGKQIYCVVTFSGNTTGELRTDKLTPKLLAPVIEFPTASSISFGKKLKDSTLSGGSTQYGSFAWKNPEIEPVVNNAGYEVVFTPNADTIAKYERITATSKIIKLTVHATANDVNKSNTYEKSKIKIEKKKNPDKKKIEKKKEIKFRDVKADDYFSEAVIWAIENKIITGTSENTFSPYDVCTRGQIVSFLWRAAGSPSSTEINTFGDIPHDAYYNDAVKWAATNKIVNGSDTDNFNPEIAGTRAQSLAMLYRYFNSPEVAQTIKFDDVQTGAYYEKAVIWATENGITKGTSENKFSPDLQCNRAQIITFLYRLYQLKTQNY